MKNTLHLFVASLLVSFSLPSFADVLTPQQALSRVETTSTGRRLKTHEAPVLDLTFNDSSSLPAVYLFSRPAGGYMVVSADDAATPLLGYSDNGTLDMRDLPPQLNYWLREYTAQIAWMRGSGQGTKRQVASDALSGLQAVAPLVKTKWNQSDPYNLYCYYLKSDTDSVKSVTGCVATAMAQVMNYFQYPSVGTGSISYRHGDSGTYSMDFSARPFDWSEMLDTYYPGSFSQEEADAVAYLMKACGYSVKMDYGVGESGASGPAIGTALIEYFGYDDGISVQTRKFFTYTEWATMIYNNLSKVGPVVYDGSALDGGHSFICDGYDGNGYFHFNWGWGGMGDGYYLLDALNPDEYGIGGAAGGYNLGQQVILGITPSDAGVSLDPVFLQTGNASGHIDDSKLYLELIDADSPGFQYEDPEPVTVTFGLKVENLSDSSVPVKYFESSKKNIDCHQGSSFTWSEVGLPLVLEDAGLAVGDSCRVSFATYITSGHLSSWVDVKPMPGKFSGVTLIRTQDGYKVAVGEVADISVSDFKVVTGKVYENLPVEFSATFTNSSDTELSRNYSVEFFNADGTRCFTTENFGITVGDESVDMKQWTSVQWYKDDKDLSFTEATEFTLRLYDNWTGTYVDGVETKVTVYPQPSDSKVEATLSLGDADEDGDVWLLSSTDFEVSLTLKVEKGFFSHPVNLDIEVPLSDGSYYSVQSRRFETIPSLSEGEEQVLTMSVSFPDAVPGREYRLQAWSDGATLGAPLSVKFETAESGVEAVVQPDAYGEFKVYSLDGRLELQTSDRQSLFSLPSGIYIVNGKKVAL